MEFGEIIVLQMELNEEHPTDMMKDYPTGLYVETKCVEFYRGWDIEIAQLVYDVLEKYQIHTVELAEQKLPIILESFESQSLKYFQNELKTDLPRVFLMNMSLVHSMKRIAEYAHGIGP